MRIVTTTTGYYEWVDVPDYVEVTAGDISSGKVKPAAGWTKTNQTWQTIAEKKYPTGSGEHTAILTERDIINRLIGEYTQNGKQRRIITRHQAVEEWIRFHVLTVARQIDQKHMVDVAIYDEGPHAELFDEVLAMHLAADHGKADGKNVDAEDAPALRTAYLTPGPSTTDHGDKVQGPKVFPEGHALAGQPHHGPAHAAGVREHLLKSFRMQKKVNP